MRARNPVPATQKLEFKAMTTDMKPLYKMFEVKDRLGFTGVTSRQQGASFMVVNNKPVPCSQSDYEGDKSTHVISFTVISVHSEGMARAPFKYNDKSKGPKPVTKPLSAWAENGGMQFWTYNKKGQDKGERIDDVTWTLSEGSTIKFFFRAEDCGKVLPAGIKEIPELTLCEISLVSKSEHPCSEGWGLTVRSLKVAQLSLYSYMNKLNAFPRTREDAKRRTLEIADEQKPMLRQFETDGPAFAPAIVSSEAYTELVDEIGIIRLWKYLPNDPSCMDITTEVAMRMTNSTGIETAMRLLDLAALTGSLRVLVFASEYRSKKKGYSECYGCPLVDTNKLLGYVSPELLENENEEYGTFTFHVLDKCGVNLGTEDPEDALVLTTFPQQEHASGLTAEAHTNDFILCSSQYQCSRAIPLQFELDKTNVVMWKGFMNTGPVQMICAGNTATLPVRRKWSSM